MSDPFNAQNVPSANAVIEMCHRLLKESDVPHVLEYLALIGSNAFACPDRCDAWALDFFNAHEDEILGEEFIELRMA